MNIEEARIESPRPQLVKASEIMRMLNISKTNSDGLIKRRLLSEGILLGTCTRRWELNEILALIASRKQQAA